jgi:hypothetical protein
MFRVVSWTLKPDYNMEDMRRESRIVATPLFFNVENQRILIHALLGHLFLFTFLGAVLYLGIKQILETELTKQSRATANAIFNNLYQGMLKGFTKKELDALVLGFKQNDQMVVLH